jgi:glycerol uptake facilitator-like aquaporin
MIICTPFQSPSSDFLFVQDDLCPVMISKCLVMTELCSAIHDFLIFFSILFLCIGDIHTQADSGASMNPASSLGPAIATSNYKAIYGCT